MAAEAEAGRTMVPGVVPTVRPAAVAVMKVAAVEANRVAFPSALPTAAVVTTLGKVGNLPADPPRRHRFATGRCREDSEW